MLSFWTPGENVARACGTLVAHTCVPNRRKHVIVAPILCYVESDDINRGRRRCLATAAISASLHIITYTSRILSSKAVLSHAKCTYLYKI